MNRVAYVVLVLDKLPNPTWALVWGAIEPQPELYGNVLGHLEQHPALIETRAIADRVGCVVDLGLAVAEQPEGGQA